MFFFFSSFTYCCLKKPLRTNNPIENIRRRRPIYLTKKHTHRINIIFANFTTEKQPTLVMVFFASIPLVIFCSLWFYVPTLHNFLIDVFLSLSLSLFCDCIIRLPAAFLLLLVLKIRLMAFVFFVDIKTKKNCWVY